MICPNCKRVISDNEICVCRLEAVKKKNEELKKEREEAERAAELEEKQRQDELQKKKDEAAERAAIAKNNIADLSTNVLSDFMEFIESPDKGAVIFVNRRNKLAVIIIFIIKIILTAFTVFSLSRSSISTIMNTRGQGSSSTIITGVIVFIISVLLDTLFNYLKNTDNKQKDILSYVCMTASKGVLQIPIMLLSIIIAPISGMIGLALVITSLVIGGTVDFLADRRRSAKSIIFLAANYVVKLVIISMILFNF